MNYYNNPNIYPNQLMFGQQQTYQQPQTYQQQPMTQLSGKMVENIDVVKITDIPFGGYGFFPRADLGEIYVKNWNPNGTTSIRVYKLDVPEENTDPQISLEEISNKIDILENKINTYFSSFAVTNQSSCKQEIKEKEENEVSPVILNKF